MMQSRGKTATIIYSYRRASENEACAGRTARSGGYSRGVDDPRWRKRRGLRPANVSGAARFIYVRWPSPGRDAPRRGRNSGVESHHGRYRPPLTCPVDQSSGGSRHHRLKESPLGERGAEHEAQRAERAHRERRERRESAERAQRRRAEREVINVVIFAWLQCCGFRAFRRVIAMGVGRSAMG
jgi:hypothetical protein